MCRGQGSAPEGIDDFIGDQAAGLELLTAVDDAVADGADLADIVDALALAGGHLLHDLSKSLGVGGEDRRGGGLVAVGLVGDHAAFHANALAQALAQHLLAVHIDQLILQEEEPQLITRTFICVASCMFLVCPLFKPEDRILQIPVFII